MQATLSSPMESLLVNMRGDKTGQTGGLWPEHNSISPEQAPLLSVSPSALQLCLRDNNNKHFLTFAKLQN